MPMMALLKPYRLATVFAATALLAGCAGEATAPAAQRVAAPVYAAKALSGIVDGVYSYTVTPGQDQVLRFGDSYLTLPANSICSLTSSYGPSEWNSACAAQTLPVTIVATIRNANTNKPSIDFQPAMRFSPDKPVVLTLQVTNAATLSNMAKLLYCGPFSATCVDESTADATLASQVNKSSNTVSRRIKHFSGYVVAE